MQRRPITIINKLGLHARAAAKLVHTASGFESRIDLLYKGQTADAKSIMGIMMLAAPQGTDLEIVADGPDEAVAVDSLATLFQERFGEDE
jgi:phosphocarrier protein HPr